MTPGIEKFILDLLPSLQPVLKPGHDQPPLWTQPENGAYKMCTLRKEFPKQQARVRALIVGSYTEIDGAGAIACMLMEESLQRADRAALRGNVVEMLRCYKELKNFSNNAPVEQAPAEQAPAERLWCGCRPSQPIGLKPPSDGMICPSGPRVPQRAVSKPDRRQYECHGWNDDEGQWWYLISRTEAKLCERKSKRRGSVREPPQPSPGGSKCIGLGEASKEEG